MFRKILVPLDGSTLAESVVPKVLRFLKVTDAKIVLLSVLPDAGLPRLDRDVILSKMEEDATEYIGQVASRLEEMAISSKALVKRAEPAEGILSTAKEEGVDLIAMATHGRTGMGRWFFGGVAEEVRSHSPVPLLLLRADGDAPVDWTDISKGVYRKVLLPLDGSALAEEAIPHALEIARAFDARVELLRVVDLPTPQGPEATTMMLDVFSGARAYLDEVSTRLKGHAKPMVKKGIPSDTILEVSDKDDIDLIVMTTHGRTGFSRFLPGSVAETVVRGSWKPVLLIRSPRPREARFEEERVASESEAR